MAAGWSGAGCEARRSRYRTPFALLGNVRGQLLKLLNERAELYGEVATDVIDTDHTAPAEIVEMIMNAHVVQH